MGEQSAWAGVTAAIAAAPYPVEVLPADQQRAAACRQGLGISTRSWLGAVAATSGGLLVDHGWLRVLGSGHGGLPQVAVGADGPLVIGYDVMGGQFAWAPAGPDATATVHYFGPEDLTWDDLELGYADWLNAMIGGALTTFYQGLRWPGWEAEVAALALDQGIDAFPPPWTLEGRDLAAVSRKAVPLAELVAVHQDMARRLTKD
jgi:hypothetical protein